MGDKRGQAAVELAIFGAILIFILGGIVRSAVSSGITQERDFRAMRMAMLASWQGTTGPCNPYPNCTLTGRNQSENLSHNTASVLFVEDRLSPDFNKYGTLDRTPYVAQGTGTFTYNLFYPVDQSEAGAQVPVMDVYINGQHFPFTTAIYTTTTLTPPQSCALYAAGSCLYNQCTRNQREWAGGIQFFQQVPNAPNGTPAFNAAAGDAAFDLGRLGVYDSSNPTFVTQDSGLRPYISWQWSSAPADAGSIGLDPSNQQYPQWDIDGRLKPVTIYSLNGGGSAVTVSYEDFQNGDIDLTWDKTSCGPKAGLQSDTALFTFTQNAYLQIKEGKLYNPETGAFVRSANGKDTIDLVQRTIQLSNNTQRFCQNGVLCPSGGTLNGITCANPNQVEVCIAPGSSDNCFSTENNIKSTCYDETDNKLFVRSRIEDLRGHSWFTDASGPLQVH